MWGLKHDRGRAYPLMDHPDSSLAAKIPRRRNYHVPAGNDKERNIWPPLLFIFLLFFGPSIYGYVRERRAKRAFLRDHERSVPFRETVVGSGLSNDPAKSRRRLKWWGGIVFAGLLGSYLFLDDAMPAAFGLALFIGGPVAFLLWRDGQLPVPLKQTFFGTREIAFEFADGNRTVFPLDEDTSMSVTVDLGGKGFVILACLEAGGEAMNASLAFAGDLDFLAHCRDAGVRLSWDGGAPQWFQDWLLAQPRWSADDFLSA